MPVKRQREETQSLIVGSTTEQIREYGGFGTSCFHSSQAGNRNRVEPWEDICWKELIGEHARESDPEPSNRLGILDGLPMEALDDLHGRKTAPVNGIDVPNAHGTQETSNTVAEHTDRDGTEDYGNRFQWHIVEDILSGKDLTSGSGNRCRGSRDSCNRVLLKVPGTIIEEGDDLNVDRYLANTTFGSPSSLELFTTRKYLRPGVTEEIGYENDKGSLDGNVRGFELETSVR